MTIETSRADTDGVITIDPILCTGCGLCAIVCKDLSITVDGIAKISNNPIFGCVGCGQCVAICPSDAIMVEGRTLSRTDYIEIPNRESKAAFSQVYNLMLARRSIRDFKNKKIDSELIEKILQAAVTAPMGIPPSSVEVLVLDDNEKVREFSYDFIDYIKKYKWFLKPTTLRLLRPFIGKDNYNAFKDFVIPLVDFFTQRKEMDEDWLLYNAPLAIYFYGAYTDPADPYIAATYAMLAAESLGLGSCMIGSVNPFLKYGGKTIKEKYNINSKVREGIIVIFGYPKYEYKKSIKRTFEKIIYY